MSSHDMERSVMGTLETAPAGQPAKRQGGTLAGIDNKKIEYITADKIGFELVPDEVVKALKFRQCLLGDEIAAAADHIVTKRRTDGSHYQFTNAWWASTRCCTIIDVTRELAATGDGRFRPNGPWSATGTIHLLSGNLQPVRSIWQRPPSQVAVSNARKRTGNQYTDEALDLLPPDVALPVRGGRSDAWQISRKGFVQETIVAMKMVGNRVRILRAVREATSKKKLDSASWTLDTLDAPIASSRPVSTGKGTGAQPIQK